MNLHLTLLYFLSLSPSFRSLALHGTFYNTFVPVFSQVPTVVPCSLILVLHSSPHEGVLCCIFSPHCFFAMLFWHIDHVVFVPFAFFWSLSKSFSQTRIAHVTVAAFSLFSPSLIQLYFLNQIFHFLLVLYFQCI